MLSNTRRRDVVTLGVGLLILANSRPYEGFLVSLPIAFCVARHFSRRAPNRGALLRAEAPALGVIILAGALLTCWYNWRVTGSPFRLPYNLYIQQYAAAPAFA
jgi:hypothetical protein